MVLVIWCGSVRKWSVIFLIMVTWLSSPCFKISSLCCGKFKSVPLPTMWQAISLLFLNIWIKAACKHEPNSRQNTDLLSSSWYKYISHSAIWTWIPEFACVSAAHWGFSSMNIWQLPAYNEPADFSAVVVVVRSFTFYCTSVWLWFYGKQKLSLVSSWILHYHNTPTRVSR